MFNSNKLAFINLNILFPKSETKFVFFGVGVNSNYVTIDSGSYV